MTLSKLKIVSFQQGQNLCHQYLLKKSSTKISEIQLASGNQNGNNATDDKRRKVAPIIIKTKKDSYGHDIIREKTNKMTNVTWGTLAFSIQDTKRGKDSSFKMKKIGHHRNISYSEKLLVQMDENEEDDDDGDRFDHNPELEENFGVRTRFNRTITNSKGEVKKIPLVLLSDSGLKQMGCIYNGIVGVGFYRYTSSNLLPL